MATNVTLPPGFVLDDENQTNTLPPGFILDSEASSKPKEKTGAFGFPRMEVPVMPGVPYGPRVDPLVALSNIPADIGQYAKGLWEAVSHPGKTAEAGAKVLSPLGPFMSLTKGEPLLQVELLKGMASRYGTPERMSMSIEETPIQTLSDVSAGLGVAGMGLKAPQLTSFASKIDPLTASLQATKGVGKYALSVPGKAFRFAQKKAIERYPALAQFKDKIPSLSSEKVQERAGKALLETETATEPYLSNIAESKKLEREIPGLQFTRAQRSGEPISIMQERALPRAFSPASNVWKEQHAQSNQAIRQYFDTVFKESESVDDVLAAIQGKQEGLASKTALAREGVESELGKVAPKLEPQKIGKLLREEATGAKGAAYGKIQELYAAIDDVPIQGEGILGKMDEIASEFASSGNPPASFPGRLFEQMRGALDPEAKLAGFVGKEDLALMQQNPKLKAAISEKLGVSGGQVPFKQLRGFQSQIWEAQGDAARAGNYTLSRRLTELGKTVADAIEDQLKTQSGQTYSQYRTAQEAYKEYDKTFRKGAVGNVLERGDLPNSKAIADMDVAGEFFRAGRLDEADEFMKALGGSKSAQSAIRDYASYNLKEFATNPVTGEINGKRLSTWLFKNRALLDKFGLQNEFTSLQKAQKFADDALKEAASFEKASLARVLNADPDKAMKILFSGKGRRESANVAKSLMEFTKDNPAAQRGVKKAMADFLFKEMQSTQLDVMQNPTVRVDRAVRLTSEYMPALRELYKNEPQKLKALINMQNAYRTLQRNVVSPLGAGSDTAENLFTAMTQEVAPFVMSRYRVISGLKAVGQVLDRYAKNQKNAFLTRAMVDEDIANTLRDAARGMYKTDKEVAMLQKKIDNQMRNMTRFGVYSAGKFALDAQQ